MQITANTPRPKPPKQERRGGLSWIFFLLILARPLWGILRSMVGPQVSDAQLWIMIAGAAALGIVGMLVARAIGGSRTGPQLPPRVEPGRPIRPAQLPATTRAGYPSQPPRFEPIITGKVILAGLALLMVMLAAGVLIWLGSSGTL